MNPYTTRLALLKSRARVRPADEMSGGSVIIPEVNLCGTLPLPVPSPDEKGREGCAEGQHLYHIKRQFASETSTAEISLSDPKETTQVDFWFLTFNAQSTAKSIRGKDKPPNLKWKTWLPVLVTVNSKHNHVTVVNNMNIPIFGPTCRLFTNDQNWNDLNNVRRVRQDLMKNVCFKNTMPKHGLSNKKQKNLTLVMIYK